MKALWLVLLLAPAFGWSQPLAQRVDRIVAQGHDAPQTALRALDELARDATLDPAGERTLWLARGSVAAGSGLDGPAQAAADTLQRSAGPLAAADAALVRALQAELRGRIDSAAEHAQATVAAYAAHCSAGAARPDCDHRPWWRALLVLHARARSEGNEVDARARMQQALELAQRAGDVYRQAWSESVVAAMSALLGEFDTARRHIAQAQRLARLDGSAVLAVRVGIDEARIASARDDAATATRLLEQALPLARRAQSPRLEALLWAHLSDRYVAAGRPRDALAAIERALPVVRRHRDQRLERVLLHNAGLSRIGLGQAAEGRRLLEQTLAMWADGGAQGDRQATLKEFGAALAAAGDVRGALELYHRERELAAAVMAANRDSALRELRSRYDREAKQRNIELLERDNALKSVQLANRALAQRLWLLAAAVLALALAAAALLYRRVRETNRRLAEIHALLRVQSERDPLTGLANRRHLQQVMRSRGANRRFEGALLLVDIDHFKRVNDGRGHAAGDGVLVEVARRLEQAVRADDIVVRWGGEEFLVLAAGVTAREVDALAERVLQAIGGAPVVLEDGALTVTASVGYALFPLPPHRVRLSWEQAVNLADMALYAAKSRGRNRAVGIAGSDAGHDDALRALEADFERASSEGRVTLTQTPGPAIAA